MTKSPERYGGFPTDPYSHSPENSGVRQPGMTGQVKEDILTRMGELGVRIEEGVLRFDGSIFQGDEFLDQPASFTFFDLKGNLTTIDLDAGEFAFTLCQVPVVYHDEGNGRVELHRSGSKTSQDDLRLTVADSNDLFSRTGKLTRIDVYFDPVSYTHLTLPTIYSV